MHTPVVSVVIACRDAEATLGAQLSALSRQRCHFSWNVVISDNGSTDGSVALARSYADRLPGLLVVDSSATAGPGYARNIGAAATRAPLLVFCDADDEAGDGWLAAMVGALQRADFVAGRFEATRLNDAATLRSRPLQQDDRLQESPFGPGLPHAGAGNLGVHRDAFFAVGGFDPGVGCLEDTDLCWRIQLSGVRLVFVPEALMHVRLRSSLRTMWRQGLNYGTASALLEHRYPTRQAVDRTEAVNQTEAVNRTRAGSAPRRPSRTAVLLGLAREQHSVGSLLWTLGWHVGHRSWHPTSTTELVSAGGSRARDAV